MLPHAEYILWRNPQRGGDGARLSFVVPNPEPDSSTVDTREVTVRSYTAHHAVTLKSEFGCQWSLMPQTLQNLPVRSARLAWENLLNEGWEHWQEQHPPVSDWICDA